MGKYQEEIFKTLTADETSFSSAYEIHQQVPNILKQLYNEFWDLVKQKLEVLTAGTDFNVGIDKNDFKFHSSIYLFLNNKSNYRCTYAHLSLNQLLGIWMKYDAINQEKATSYREQQMEEFSGWTTNSFWWLAYKEIGDDLSKTEYIVRILPDSREEYSTQKAQELFDFAKVNKVHLEYMIDNCEK